MVGLLLLAILAAPTRGERMDARCRNDRRISSSGLCGTEADAGTSLPPLPSGAIVALLANNIDGSDNATLSNGALIPTWENLGSATVADFAQADADKQPSMRKVSGEQAGTFDGVFDLMTSPGSKAPLGFIHSTGVFDVILVVRRTNTSVTNERRLFGGCEGQAGLAVLLLTGASEGAIWVILGNGSGLITNLQTTITTPLGTPYKVLVRGDGTQTRVSHDFSTFQSQAFGAALGSGDSFYDYSIGAANPSQTTPLTFAGEVFDVLVYDRNLSPAELSQVTAFLDAQIGSGT